MMCDGNPSLTILPELKRDTRRVNRGAAMTIHRSTATNSRTDEWVGTSRANERPASGPQYTSTPRATRETMTATFLLTVAWR